ncbi:MAG: glycosyl hydrolase [Chitinophagaceae bacterium]|nr:glycosyl hydrolase [Chitinophagaceae bacterium]
MQYLLKSSFSFLILFSGAFFLTAFAQVKPTTAAERMNGLQKRKLLETNSLLKDISFRNIGPTQMNGRVVDIEVNPADPTEFYVAYATGGLWHTTNNGLSFDPLFDKEDVISIGDIAVNWKSKMIWVGTGEANSSRSSYSGNGVYKSSDNGKSWECLGLPESHHIGEIILHPANDYIAWVAVLGHLYSPNKERGVYKTTDGGKTWKQTLRVDDNTGAVEMDINLKDPNELYACAWYRTRRAWDFVPFGTTSGIYKSYDGGDSWKLITAAGSGFPAGEKVGRCGVAVSQKNPQVVYAVVDNNAINSKPDTSSKKIDTSKYRVKDFKAISKEKFAVLDNNKLDTFLIYNDFPKKYTAAGLKELVATGKLKPTDVYDWLVADDGFQNDGIYGCEVYRSDDAGMHWKKMNEKDIGVFSSYGYYFGKIYVSPADENKVITFGTGIIVSNDGGKTFTQVDKDNTHGDWHSCWIDPNRDSHWIGGNDGGCNITYDNGKKWFKSASVPAGQFYNIAVDNATPYNVYGGLQDNGVWMGASNTDGNGNNFSFAEEKKEAEPEEYKWKPIGDGDGMQVQVDTRDNKTAYAGFQFGYYYRANTDGGEPAYIHPMQDLGEQKLRYNWQTPIWLSRHNQDVFYYGSNKFHRSLNKAAEMVTLSGDLSNGKKEGKVPYGTLTTITESALRFGLIYIGTDDGNIQVSKDGGYTWTMANVTQSLSKTDLSKLWVSRVTASKYKEGRVYATLNGYRYDNFTPYLFVSEDYGSAWKQLGTDLPAEPLNVVREDAKNENILYVGSDNGLYASFDMGKTFMTIGCNLPRVPVHDLVIQERENELVAGTHGRSIYIAKLDSVYKAYEKFQQALQIKASIKPDDQKQLPGAGAGVAADDPKGKKS